MTGALAQVAPPLESAALHRGLPSLAAALDTKQMSNELGTLLFPGSEFAAECERAKPELTEDGCTIHYAVRISTHGLDDSRLLVLGTLLPRRGDAERYEVSHLRPLAASLGQPWPAPRISAVLPALGLALSVFPVSGSHPTLVDAVDHARVTQALRRLLDDKALAVADVQLVQLRRSRGCVLRYRLEGARHSIVFGKVGYPAAAPDVKAALEVLGRHNGTSRASVVFPRGLGRSAELDETFVEELPGRPPDLQQETERARAVDAAAAVAAHLHASGIPAGSEHTLAEELARARRPVQLLARYDPALSARLNRMLDALARRAEQTSSHALVFSHGSLAPSQLMFDGDRTALLDFERVCQAEPAFDLGRFLASLRIAVSRKGGTGDDQLAARFLEGYLDAGGGHRAVERAPLYECAALVRSAAHSWLQLKASRLQHALAVLEARFQAIGVAS